METHVQSQEMKKWLKKLWKDSQEMGYTFRKPEELTEPERLGFVEVNRTVCDERDTMFAARITPTGMDFADIDMDWAPQKQKTSQPAKSEKETKMTEIQIETAAIPEVKRARGRKPGQCKYPFDALEVETNNSFFIADQEGKPAIKTVSPSVAEANRRYSEPIEGETRTNRKGNVVPATHQLRKFIVRKVDGGARVFRVL